MMKIIYGLLIFAVAATYSAARADVRNPSAFVGERVLGATPGAPITVDANLGLVSGEPATTYVGSAASTSVATNAAYATIAGLTLSPTFAGTYQVHCRTAITHATNNADTLMAVHVAGTIVSDSIVSVRAFIQGGVTPSLSVPMVLYTNTEVVITAGQAITCAWRTSAGTVTAPNARSLMITRIR